MSNWKKVILEKDGCPVKVYVNETDTRAIMFPLYGKYFSFCSDVSALDLTIGILFHRMSDDNHVPTLSTYQSYLNSQEDTAIIYQEAA